MKVLHVIPSLSPSQGGPSFALPLIARSLVEAGIQVDVAATDDDGPGAHASILLSGCINREGVNYFYFHKQTEFYKGSLPFLRWIGRHVCEYDLIHIHALFSFVSNAAARAARRNGIPYIIRPLGVLNRWGMVNRRRWLKALSFRLIEQPILQHAAAIHYTSHQEQREAEESGVNAPAAVIPLGIDVEKSAHLPDAELFYKQFPKAAGRPIVLFLSRLDPKKGLDLLFPAFAEVQRLFPECLLVLAGSGKADFVANLRDQAIQLGIESHILWTGFLDAQEKLAALSAAQVFVLPSYSENFGIALVEALAAGLPCVVCDGVAVAADVRECEAGIVVPCAIEPLAAALVKLLSNESLRNRMASNALQLAAERFSLKTMGASLNDLYLRIISKEKRWQQ